MALLKDLIVQGASRFIGDAYFATIKEGVWNGTPIDLSHGGTAGETIAGKILTSTTTSGTSAWTAASNITVGTATTATKLSTVSKTAWGQTYWTSGGVPTSISGTIDPGNNVTSDCGTSSNAWLNVYSNKLVSNTTLTLISAANTSLIFKPQETEAGRFNTSGNLIIGLSSGQNDITDLKLYINGATTITGTLTLTKIQDLSGTANNSPALIIGGAASAAHMEIDANEIHAKDGAAINPLYLNRDGGLVYARNKVITELNTTTTTAGKIFVSTTVEGRGDWINRDNSYGGINVYTSASATTASSSCLAHTYTETLKIIQGNCMTITASNGDTEGTDALTIGVSDAYKSVIDYYAKTAYYTNDLTISPTKYDKGASTVSITVTLTPKKEGAAYTTTESDTATYGTSSSMGTAMTRNTNTFTATYTFTPNSSSGNITFYGRTNLGGITLTRQSKTLTMQQKVYYGKSTSADLSDLNFSDLSYVLASDKGSKVNAPAGNGTTEYWWFATPFVNNTNGIMWNTTTNETNGCEYKGSLSMNNSTYYVWRTISIAASLQQGWTIGKDD